MMINRTVETKVWNVVVGNWMYEETVLAYAGSKEEAEAYAMDVFPGSYRQAGNPKVIKPARRMK